MSKIAGILFIAVGSLSVVIGQIRRKRQELSLLQALIGALRTMEGAIHWKGQTVPCCLQELSERKYCGIYFRNVLKTIESGNALQNAWEKGFMDMPVEVKSILRQMEWGGDETHLLGNLRCTIQGLSEYYHRKKQQQHNEEKLLIAAIGSAAGMLIIILL